MRRRALLFVMTLVWMAVWVPPAIASYRLERADGSSPTRGLSIPRTLVLADVHWPVVDAPPPPPAPPVVRQPTRLPSAPSGGCYTEPGTPSASVMGRESRGDPRVWNGGAYHKLPGHSTASGCWQIIRGTWGGYKGFTNAADAPVHIQNERAKQLNTPGNCHWGC